jgi:hypothetical protein
MELDDFVQALAGVVAAIVAATFAVFGFWRARSMVRIWRAGERHLRSSRASIWHDPGPVETLDLAAGPGGRDGAPEPPFVFVEEHLGGSQPCMSVRDRRGRRWRVKWGDEVQVETLATRLAWAAGFFVEICYYVAEGRVDGAHDLRRATAAIEADGRFTAARFELDDPAIVKHFDEHSWAWHDNPFVGSPELHGLKIVMMWLSNWDAKDVRDVARGSNTAIFECETAAAGERRSRREARYLIIDWGGALGQWGSIVRRGRWDCAGFAAETDRFITGVDGDQVRFGYTGQRTADIAAGIRVSDVRWLMRTLGRLTDRQIAAAVAASGGTADEIACFTAALRRRLDRLQEVASSLAPAASQP